MKPEVSVVLPVYNAERTLVSAVGSILRQTFADFELVAVDDGSADDSLSLLKSLAFKDNRIRILGLGHSGIVSALNAGLAEAKGEFIARMDADDVSHPRRLELQLSYLRKHDDCALLGGAVRLFPRSRLMGGMLHYERWVNSVVAQDEIMRDLFIESPFPHPSVMFRRDAALSLGGYRDMGWPEDYDLWLRIAKAGMGMAKLRETVLYWREGEGRLSRSDGMYSAESFRLLKSAALKDWRLAGTKRVQVWGAGRDGKTWAKLLMKTGFEVVQFIDIDRKKVGGRACGGRSTGGIPVVWPGDIIKGLPVLCAVGIKGAREQIRDYLSSDGYREPQEFFFLS